MSPAYINLVCIGIVTKCSDRSSVKPAVPPSRAQGRTEKEGGRGGGGHILPALKLTDVCHFRLTILDHFAEEERPGAQSNVSFSLDRERTLRLSKEIASGERGHPP